MGFSNFVTLICATVVVLVNAQQAEYAQTILTRTCKRDSKDLSSCLRLAIQETWPNLMKGVPNLNIPALDPFNIDHHEYNFENGNLRGKLTIAQTKVYGLSKARFASVQETLDKDKIKFEIDLSVPKMFVEGDFKVDGYFGEFQVGNKGTFNVSLGDVRVNLTLIGHIENDFAVYEHVRASPVIGKVQVWFSDVFSNSKELSRAAVDFVNQNWEMVYKITYPHVVEELDKESTIFFNKVSSHIPFSTFIS